MPINAPLNLCGDTMVYLSDGDDEVAELGVDGGLALEAAGDGLGQGPQRQGAQLRHRQRHSRLSLRRRLGPERGIRLPLLVESKATA